MVVTTNYHCKSFIISGTIFYSWNYYNHIVKSTILILYYIFLVDIAIKNIFPLREISLYIIKRFRRHRRRRRAKNREGGRGGGGGGGGRGGRGVPQGLIILSPPRPDYSKSP